MRRPPSNATAVQPARVIFLRRDLEFIELNRRCKKSTGPSDTVRRLISTISPWNSTFATWPHDHVIVKMTGPGKAQEFPDDPGDDGPAAEAEGV
jgi:hypothetical protein